MKAIPCYAGPYDGRFCTDARTPSGYSLFRFRGKQIYLWDEISKTKLNFAVLERAAKKEPSEDEEIHK